MFDLAAERQIASFYEHFVRGGMTKASSLRAAQLETLAALRAGALRTPAGRPLRNDPVYWSPFVLVGEPE